PVASSLIAAVALAWWLRPVMMHDREGEHSAVVCMLVYSSPPVARASGVGVGAGCRRGDGAAVAAQLPKPGVIQHDKHHVGGISHGPHRLRPRRARLARRPPDYPRERRARLVLVQRHATHLP